MENMIDIDLVYLWVNGNDPVWKAKHDAFEGKQHIETDLERNGKSRYTDNGELKYSLRSVELYAPWIRKIFIVTDNQTPDWLDTTNPKIRIVDHTEIMPPECLPCFSSTLIEHFLHKIPGLSEYFLYANDDVFINKPVTPDTFFAPDGWPIIRLLRKPFRKQVLAFREKVQGKTLNNYKTTIRNSARLVEMKYGTYYGGKPHHNIDAYRKSSYEHVAQVFKNEIEATWSNHIRNSNDIQRVIYNYTALAEKRGHLKYVSPKDSFQCHIDNAKELRQFERINPMLFCINDGDNAQDSDRQALREHLEKRFPEKSPFEK